MKDSVTGQIRIGFIGGGNMARAMITGLLAAGHEAGRIRVADRDSRQRAELRKLNPELRVVARNADAVRDSEVLVLAVKPQVLDGVAEELAGMERAPDQVVVSVAAGVPLAQLRSSLGSQTPLVRVMPNTPALVGAGIAGVYAGPEVGESARANVSYTLESTGELVWLTEEAQLDAVTAVSGSGPAYFFLLMEILEDVGRELGIAPADARRLAVRTAAGAGKLAELADESPGELRARVTSPGGTTAAALETLESAGIRDIVRAALIAARDRAVELGQRTSSG